MKLLDTPPLSSAAVSRGATFHGKPCRKCGETLRYQNNQICVSCARKRHKRTP